MLKYFPHVALKINDYVALKIRQLIVQKNWSIDPEVFINNDEKWHS